MRLLFGILGATACVIAALIAEPVFRRISATRAVDDHVLRVLIYRSDIGRRLERAGAARGEVEVALDWNDKNDLDLHVIDPHGFEVYYNQKRSRDGGTLDVDANMSAPYTTSPIEHIVWPYGRAPIGRYEVRVKYYRNHGGPDPTTYHVEVREESHVRHYSGHIMPDEEQTVCNFDVGRKSGAFSSLFAMLVRAILITGGWTLLLSTWLAAALTGGQQLLYYRRYRERLVAKRDVPRIIGHCALIGLVAGVIGQLLYSIVEVSGVTQSQAIEQELGWALLGAILGAGLARRIPNLPSGSALWAGLVGGMLGSYCFVSTLQTGSDSVGRVAASGVLGLLIGLMIRLVFDPDVTPAVIEVATMTIQPMRLRGYRTRTSGALRPPKPPGQR